MTDSSHTAALDLMEENDIELEVLFSDDEVDDEAVADEW